MRRRVVGWLAFIIALGAGAVSPAAAGQDPQATAPRIEMAAFKKLFEAGNILVVDVRDAASFSAGHIPGAVLVPLEMVELRAAELAKARKPIITYCS